MTILEQIAALHPNALVAWDRDGISLPDFPVLVWNWGGLTRWEVKGPDDFRDDGLGAVVTERFNPHPYWRAVLYVDPTNELGVSWWHNGA